MVDSTFAPIRFVGQSEWGSCIVGREACAIIRIEIQAVLHRLCCYVCTDEVCFGVSCHQVRVDSRYATVPLVSYPIPVFAYTQYCSDYLLVPELFHMFLPSVNV